MSSNDISTIIARITCSLICGPGARFRDRYPDSGGHYQSNGGNSNFQAFCQKVAVVFQAMGLPVVKAPGEAEAVCAALDAAGLVQGVATKDSDALVMGAHTVYHTVELHVRCTTAPSKE